MNAIGVIAPYKYEGQWVFDDPAVGLVREPFVSGIDKMIDKLVAPSRTQERVPFAFLWYPFPATRSSWSGGARIWRQPGIIHRCTNGRLAVPGIVQIFRFGPSRAVRVGRSRRTVDATEQPPRNGQ